MKSIKMVWLSGFFLFLYGSWSGLLAQGSDPELGLHQYNPGIYAFKNCTLVKSPGEVVNDATLVVQDGKIKAAGVRITIPKGATVYDLKGYWVFPAFVEAYMKPKPKEAGGRQGRRADGPQYFTKKEGPYYWNQAIQPELRIGEGLDPDSKQIAGLRQQGFGMAQLLPGDGIYRGTSSVIQLRDGKVKENLVRGEAGAALSFRKGTSLQAYPSSLMGAIALIRQVFEDAKWYQRCQQAWAKNPDLPQPEGNLSLEAIIRHRSNNIPFFFEVRDYQTLLRAATLSEEIGVPFVYKTGGDEYKVLDAVRKLERPLIVPLSFPDAYKVEDPAAARDVTLGMMMDWEQAPLNAGRLEQAGIPFAITHDGIKKPGQFWPALRKALTHGLSPEAALKALTVTPAELLGLKEYVGSLEEGMLANFLVCSGDLFREKAPVIHESWIGGFRHILKPRPDYDLQGTWALQLDNASPLNLKIKGNAPGFKTMLLGDNDSVKVNLKLDGEAILLSWQPKQTEGYYRLRGLFNGELLEGIGTDPEGFDLEWSAQKQSGVPEDETDLLEAVDLSGIPEPVFPPKAYGFRQAPAAVSMLIRGATVWTNTDAGVLENTDVRIAKGKIVEVGKDLKVGSKDSIVDGKGFHLTPGIIDEHSHIAISRGVNEGSHAVTAEVSIADVVNCEDVNIYRQLSGGVTASQLLHGSANPIGGQSAIIKLRWGSLPEEMKFEAAPGFIKFALGENVKQANWGDGFRSRYPQTRAGVEQRIRDAFQAARDYEARWKNWKKSGKGKLPPRKDFQMETLLEILRSERFVTCHSYVQSEITMLMRLAESFGFRINTFTHVLEGYKIADKLKAHGANASSFSDWWAYKFEVIDAIPHNAALMAEQGVNVCLNSDDAEMGRRLNQEAAKAVLYGGASEEEALKMVTLNPAKTLRIDDRVGSIEKGKDADVVLWTDHPLSVYAKVEKTIVDGKVLFDREQDLEARKVIRDERLRISAKMMADKGQNKQFPMKPGKRHYHCETLESDYNHE